MDALHRLEAAGVPVLNPPRAVEAAVDKYLASALIHAAGLPVPETWVGESAEGGSRRRSRNSAATSWSSRCSAPRGGGWSGSRTASLPSRAFRTMERLGMVLYVQRHVRNPGFDIRLFVLGRRDPRGDADVTPRAGEWRANVAVGGRPEAWSPDR